MDPSILIVVLVFMATVGATFSGFKTVNLIVKGDTWQLWAILTGVLILLQRWAFFCLLCSEHLNYRHFFGAGRLSCAIYNCIVKSVQKKSRKIAILL